MGQAQRASSAGELHEPHELHEAAARCLARIGQRYTSGRHRLVEVLAASARPVTAAELVGLASSVPQSTAYRNLAILAQAGVVNRVVGNDDLVRYELAEEMTGLHHHHLVCVICGVVEDFAVPPRFEKDIGAMIGEVAQGTGFLTATHRLDLLGTCASCSR